MYHAAKSVDLVAEIPLVSSCKEQAITKRPSPASQLPVVDAADLMNCSGNFLTLTDGGSHPEKCQIKPQQAKACTLASAESWPGQESAEPPPAASDEFKSEFPFGVTNKNIYMSIYLYIYTSIYLYIYTSIYI